MMNKKTNLIIAGIVAIIATVSGVYMYENMYSSVSVGQVQYTELSFDQKIAFSDFALVGTVVDKEIVLLQYDSMDTDENGIEYVADSDRRPFQKITLRVDEYFRDTTGNFDPMMIFYEMSTDGLGWDNDMRTMYYVPNPQTYNLGDQNFYFIETESDYPGKYVIGGFGSKYNIITDDNGVKYIQSGIDIHFDHPLRLYSDAISDVIGISNESMTPEMIAKRDNYKP